MNRIWSMVSGTLRALTPKVLSGSPSMEINSSKRHAEHLARVREAMESLAPKDQALPSQGRAVASQAEKSGSDSYRTAPEMFAAANALFQGDGVPQDKQEAFRLWKQAGDSGHLIAMYSYASCLRNGEGTEPDLAEALSVFERLASAGLREAQYALGLVLSTNEGERVGMPKDEVRARELFTSAARAGFAPAINNAALMMAAGRGGDKDEERAVRWYEVSVETGDPAACYTLATWYCSGRAGLAEDWRKGYELHARAAEMGIPQAQFNTGVHFFSGKGVDQDLKEAAKWFRKAADQGMPEAIMNLAKMTVKGMGVARDREQALGLYQQASRIIGQAGQDVDLDDAVVAEILGEAGEDRGKEHGRERKDSSTS